MPMLNLASETRDSWLSEVKGSLPDLLIDHAHCEKKAASTAINLIFRYPQHEWLLRPLSALAREELEHFELMLDVLSERGLTFTRTEPSAYAGRLMKSVRRGDPERLIDTLLCCSLIEARSCERMKILSTGLEDPILREFYGSLLASEARHHHIYVDMACKLAPRESVRARLKELARAEADALEAPHGPVRMHS